MFPGDRHFVFLVGLQGSGSVLNRPETLVSRRSAGNVKSNCLDVTPCYGQLERDTHRHSQHGTTNIVLMSAVPASATALPRSSAATDPNYLFDVFWRLQAFFGL